MTSRLASTLSAAQHAERTAALRHLLRHPLTFGEEDSDIFAAIVRNREWLVRWFAEQPGWKLVVESAAGFARLHKVPARLDASRPARSVASFRLPVVSMACPKTGFGTAATFLW